MRCVVTGRIRQKLEDKHGVVPEEINQCFYNRTVAFLKMPERSIGTVRDGRQHNGLSQRLIPAGG